jgi:ABC-type sugar transport system permease subunit
MEPAGFRNFEFVFHDPAFTTAIGNTARLLLAVPLLAALAALLAAALHDQTRGWRIQRTLIFLPYVLPVVAIGLTFSQVLRGDGILNGALQALGLDFLALDWIGSTSLAIWSVLAVIVWKELGLGMTLCLARLQGVDPEVYEAARIDGAGWWQQFRWITLPELRDVLALLVVIETVTIASWIFAYVFTLTGGGPGNSSTVVELYLYRRMFGLGASGGQDIGAAAAVGVLTLAGLVALFLGSWLVVAIARRIRESRLWQA